MTKKERPSLTPKHCLPMEVLRLGLEVYTGFRVMFNNLDLNSGKAHIFLGLDQEPKLIRCYYEEGDPDIEFEFEGSRYYVEYVDFGFVRVTDIHSNKMECWVGKSFAEREREI